MAINLVPIAQSYWRLIKRGKKTYDSLNAEMKALVKELAKADVADNVITAEEYERYIGEKYPTEE
jgi:hypothetical protein